MIRFNIQLNIEKPKWWYKIFQCKHEVVIVEENFKSRYGTKTSYMYCLKCGRKAMDILRNCKHKVLQNGECEYCLDRINYPCNENHEWVNEPDTNEKYCDKCLEWE